jgi:hypothetical protein
VQPSEDTPPHPLILENHRFNPYFKNCVGNIDGTLIPISIGGTQAIPFQTHRSGLGVNVLAACTFNLRFTYILTGWEGSKPNALLLQYALKDGFRIPAGKKYLGDAGFPFIEGLLIPFRGTCYHLKEWKRSQSS